MATVYIAPQLRDLTGDATTYEVSGATVRDAIAELESQFPGIAARIQDGDRIIAGLAVSIDGVMDTRGLGAPVAPTSEIHFLPAIGGG